MPQAWNFKQELVGVFGCPVAENPTQAMIEPAFQAMGLDWRYLTVEVAPADLADAVKGARAMGWRGFNCTIPHKINVIPLLDELSDAARVISAVNCVIHRSGKLIGENTDGKGFLESLRSLTDPSGLDIAILGAGGAARAIGFELALAGARSITIVSRNTERGRGLAAAIQDAAGTLTQHHHWSGAFSVPRSVHVLVNATPIGLYPDSEAEVPVESDSLRPGLIVCDVIPNPPRTPLIKRAEAARCHTLDGLGMLVNQGVLGIKAWSGADPSPAVMRTALERLFGSPPPPL